MPLLPPENTKSLMIRLFHLPPSSFGLLSTPKCTASCCLLRTWKLILVLVLAQPNLETNQPRLPLQNKGLQSLTEVTSDFQALWRHATAQCDCGVKNNYSEFWKHRVHYICLFLPRGCSAFPSLPQHPLLSDKWWCDHPLRTPLHSAQSHHSLCPFCLPHNTFFSSDK